MKKCKVKRKAKTYDATGLSKFTHLHFHTEFSLLDGVGRCEDIVSHCAKMGAKSLAITDHRTTSGWFEFARACKEKGVKPIFGVEMDICDDNDVSKKEDFTRKHIVLLAINQVGFVNILRLTSDAWSCVYRGRARINWGMLSGRTEGVMCLTACIQGVVNSEILGGTGRESHVIERLKKLFGDNLYLELQSIEMVEQITCNKRLIELSDEHDIPLVITNDVHYATKRDSKFQEVLVALRLHTTIAELERRRMSEQRSGTLELYVKDRNAQFATFKSHNPHIPDEVVNRALDNTMRVAEMCNSEFKMYSNLLPKVPVAEGFENNADYLVHLVNEFDLLPYINRTKEKWRKARESESKKRERNMWLRKIKTIDSIYKDRLKRELELIIKKKYQDYFILVSNMCKFAIEKGIYIGAGRGSVVGSLVAFCIGIHNADPIYHDCVFERFLDETRTDLPDIDLDFEDARREEVKKYLHDTFGVDNVVSITNAGRMKERMVLDDVGRVMKVPREIIEEAKAYLVREVGADIKEGGVLRKSKDSPELMRIAKAYPIFFEAALKLEGQLRQMGVHAAGVLVTPEEVWKYLSVEKRSDVRVTSYDGKQVEQMGLAKLDILGLKTLSVIKSAETLIGEQIGWGDLDLSDQAVIDGFASGNTIGVFQFECVDGDTKVMGPGGIEYTISDRAGMTVNFLLGLPDSDIKKPLELDTTTVFPVGEKLTWTVETETGEKLVCTGDEEFLTPNGYVKLNELVEGDFVAVVDKNT